MYIQGYTWAAIWRGSEVLSGSGPAGRLDAELSSWTLAGLGVEDALRVLLCVPSTASVSWDIISSLFGVASRWLSGKVGPPARVSASWYRSIVY